ncbi:MULTISPECIES: efflux RND transporter periplasmic adaptor subunit [unclassified Caballeronia]|uniref:efflux RND transporter periplasmic adaptor subunit n=1 Tax=unclassified Caballeronia TaxID=2646786 RepID=UPI0020291809|nr:MULTISPECIES: efflux RND transporter periplasmic adaptor subunit [unclassified Caballeronia]MDR5771549.1 efflux RND transporter periplasmic adaptor subunit [Caballeronia sp. LZ002]MDR5805336.1 efflux RND transporter periplasmic adaptor subunit [Caballeronia sp. LZ001]MDR5846985.1 efflux RND transporter periplasmic adaptor subunit [Caballeronia sp. LZ003]
MNEQSNERSTRKRGRMWLVIALVVVVLLVAQGIWSRHSAHAELERDAGEHSVQTVEIIKPTRMKPTQDLVLAGDIRAFSDAPIFARTNGYLKRWTADIGTKVRKGQLLAEIDAPEINDQLRQARADAQTARANYLLAKTTADRWVQMAKNNSVSRQETDEKTGDMLAKEAAFNASQANVSRLEQMVSFQKIYAPFDGVVTARNTDVGQLIDAGSAGIGRELFHIQDATTLRVFVDVPQAYARLVTPGLPAELILNEERNRKFEGVTVRTAGAVDPVARTMRVEVGVKNPSGELLAGAYAQVRFHLTNASASYTLPGNALLFRPDGVHAASVDANNRVKLLPITLGTDYGTRVSIAAGLSGDERVIVNPPDSIIDGAAVRIGRANATPGASQPKQGGEAS